MGGLQSTAVGGSSLVSAGKETMKGGGRRTFAEVVGWAWQLQGCPLVLGAMLVLYKK
jgi:hypothetical protein